MRDSHVTKWCAILIVCSCDGRSGHKGHAENKKDGRIHMEDRTSERVLGPARIVAIGRRHSRARWRRDLVCVEDRCSPLPLDWIWGVVSVGGALIGLAGRADPLWRCDADARIEEATQEDGAGYSAWLCANTLTRVQRVVLYALAQDHLSERAIAEQLQRDRKTVEKHCRNIYRTLGVHTRQDAVAAARQRGWLE